MLIGEILKQCTGATKHGDHYRYKLTWGSVSLGEYIFLSPSRWNDTKTLNHERGHRIQSRMLGWLYLPVVGIPSIIWAGCFDGYRKKHNVSYYSFYTERWADRLGGVER